MLRRSRSLPPSAATLAALSLVAAAAAAAVASAAAPEQVHIALAGADAATGRPTGMRVAWFTQDPAASVARYGTEATILDRVANGSSTQYLDGHGYHHVALLDCGDLPASRAVYYQVGDGESSMSPVFSFRTSPASNASVRVSIFGDMGYEDSSQRPMIITLDGLVKDWSATYSRQTLESLKNRNAIDMVWHVGDIGYMDDAFAHNPIKFLYEESYNGYMNWLQNLTSELPYMVAPGNHESECHSAVCLLELKKYGTPLSNFTAYNKRWHMPSSESGGKHNMWYSFNFGPIHFVSINTETDFPGAGEEHTGDSGDKRLPAGGFGSDGEYLRWLEADLAAADAARRNGSAHGRPWLIAGGHRPFEDIEALVAPLFDKYSVDMYFAGHGHSYSRSGPTTSSGGWVASPAGSADHVSTPVYNNPNGTVYIMAGGAGCDEMKQATEDFNEFFGEGVAVPAGSQVITSSRYATGVLEANTSALVWQLIDSVDGTIIDHLTITKS